jgi:hypothetical protein
MCPWTGSPPSQTFVRTDGTRTGPETWQEADAAAVAILSASHDTHDEDLADGIEACIKKDGGNSPSAAIDWNAQLITNYGAPTARTNAQRVDKVQDSVHVFAGTSAGTDTITATLSPAITDYVAGQRYHFKAGGTNTGAATINFNSVGAGAIKKGAAGSTALGAGDITTGGAYSLIYDGTNFQLENPGLGQNISAFMATVLDDADASTARGTLGLGTMATQAASAVAITGGSITGITDIALADGGTGASTATAARTNLGAILTDAVFPGALVAIIEDNKASGTDGGTFTSGADRTRDLNTLVYSRNSVVSIASNQITIAAGSWLIKWSAPAHMVNEHQSFLYDITAGAEVTNGRGASVAGTPSNPPVTFSDGSVRVTPAGSNVYEIRHRCATTVGTNGFGLAASFGTEVYTRVEIYAA